MGAGNVPIPDSCTRGDDEIPLAPDLQWGRPIQVAFSEIAVCSPNDAEAEYSKRGDQT